MSLLCCICMNTQQSSENFQISLQSAVEIKHDTSEILQERSGIRKLQPYDTVEHAKWWLFLLRFSVSFQKLLEYIADEGAALQWVCKLYIFVFHLSSHDIWHLDKSSFISNLVYAELSCNVADYTCYGSQFSRVCKKVDPCLEFKSKKVLMGHL